MLKTIISYLSDLEQKINTLVINKLPQLSSTSSEWLVKYLPPISAILGLFSLLSAYNLWHTAHSVNSLISYANTYGRFYGTPKVPLQYNLNVAFWISLILLVIEAVFFIFAYGDTKKRLKAGWDLVYYALLTNVLYGIAMLFSSYGGFGILFWRLVFSAICLYGLFEIREYYKFPHHSKAKTKSTARKHIKAHSN